MDIHSFTGFKLDLVPCSEAPMSLMIEGAAACTIELPSTGEFHVLPVDDVSDYHLVMFKMDGSKNNTPEIVLHALVSELERFKQASVLPVIC
ncbi:hypothetical protein PL84_03725 [Vibrio anguillarum]|uniref:hypothetical protein n=1 Tax=Vibrio anguillarum TaxID=55601 RepID=UPI001AD83CCD|nr:hypothetical protein [Vibrio anguillarum]MBT2909691.1 hypothetical protein [Vibrio anguillarum]MBT2942458.1 hypothetical protein [Vibrio anguillarum]MBT2950718.1 hypothetical protein [Vibrio anguillarum]MBT2979604.1 hypothetical protein [Vibrio anguillarum]